MRTEEKNKALKLRIENKMSYGEIAKRLSVSKSTLSVWLRGFPLSEERVLFLRKKAWSRGEAGRERFRETMREKRQEKEDKIYVQQLTRFKKISPQALFVAGLMLYLGEGDKKDRCRVSLANTDPWVITFFVWWMKKFLGISKTQIKVQLHLYKTMNISVERKFWQQKIGIGRNQFYKDQIRPLRPSSFSYRESYRHGTCKIYAGGVKEKTELMLSIKAFLDTYNR